MNNDGWWKKITLIGLSYLFFITKAVYTTPTFKFQNAD